MRSKCWMFAYIDGLTEEQRAHAEHFYHSHHWEEHLLKMFRFLELQITREELNSNPTCLPSMWSIYFLRVCSLFLCQPVDISQHPSFTPHSKPPHWFWSVSNGYTGTQSLLFFQLPLNLFLCFDDSFLSACTRARVTMQRPPPPSIQSPAV